MDALPDGGEKYLSVAHCTRFILMQETKLKEAFCFGDHYKFGICHHP
jgi:hypothetical protein